MFKAIIARTAVVVGSAAIAAAALIGFTGTANAAGLCPLDRPCGSLTYTSSNATVTARINDGNEDADFFQVRWTLNRNGVVQSYPQQRVALPAPGRFSYSSFGPIAAADRGYTVGFAVQGCTSGLFGTSCSGWHTQTIVPLPYGPDTCASGYVWRDAFVGDHVCVTTTSRNQAASDNAAARYRVNPNGAYGPQTCINGYVWRVARSTDLVCVTPAIRQQTANENANPLAHRA